MAKEPNTMPLEKDFIAVQHRIAALRKTKAEFCAEIGMTKTRFWRAINGLAKQDAQVRALRDMEAGLDKLEKASV